MSIDYTLIGKRVAMRRKQLKLTQAELAEKTSLTPKFISNIETSHSIPSIESIMQLSLALDVDANYLLLNINDKKVTATTLDEIIRLLSAGTPEQLSKILEYVEYIMSR